MKEGTFLLVTSSIFTLIALLHALRLIYGWSVTIGEWTVPVWVSAVGFLIAGYLALQGLLLKRLAALLVALAFSVLLAAPLAGEAQQTGKVARIGFLSNIPIPGLSLGEAFFDGLRELGYGEGQNLAIERRSAEGRVQRIVMVASSSDPVGEGLIQSFARPGGNITGLVTAPEALVGKRLELLKETVPGLSRVGLLWDATLPLDLSTRMRTDTEAAARLLRVELRRFDVREPTDLDSAVSAAAKERVGGLIVVGSPMLTLYRGKLADLLSKHRLPAISLWRSFAEAGLLMTYGPSLAGQFRRAAYFVRGRLPSETVGRWGSSTSRT